MGCRPHRLDSEGVPLFPSEVWGKACSTRRSQGRARHRIRSQLRAGPMARIAQPSTEDERALS